MATLYSSRPFPCFTWLFRPSIKADYKSECPGQTPWIYNPAEWDNERSCACLTEFTKAALAQKVNQISHGA